MGNHSTPLCYLHVPGQCPPSLKSPWLETSSHWCPALFCPLCHGGSHNFFLCYVSQVYVLFSVLLVLDFWSTLLQEPLYLCPFFQRPPPNPRSQSRQASSLLSPHPPIPLTQTIWWLLTLTKESLHFKNSHKSSISDSLSLSKFLRIPAPTSLCFPHRLKSSSISSFSRWWNVLEWDLGGSIIWKCPHLWDRGLATPPFLMWDERWGTQLSGETFPLNLKWGWVPVEMEPGWCLLSLCSWNNEASESRAFPLEPSSWLSSQFCSCGPYLMMKKWKGKFTYWDERPFQLSDMFQL